MIIILKQLEVSCNIAERDYLQIIIIMQAVNFDGNDMAEYFKVKSKFTCKTNAVEKKGVEIVASLEYPGSFWGTLDMWLNNCEIELMLPWSTNVFSFQTR